MKRRGFLQAMGALALGAVAPLKLAGIAEEVTAEPESGGLDAIMIMTAGAYQFCWQAAMNVDTDRTTVRCEVLKNGESCANSQLGGRHFFTGSDVGVASAAAFCDASEGDAVTVRISAEQDVNVNIVHQQLTVARVDGGSFDAEHCYVRHS